MTTYASAQRLDRLRALLRGGRCTVASIAAKFGTSPYTARRMVGALEDAGEPLVEEILENGAKSWSLPLNARTHTVRLTTAQLTALLVARNSAREFLRGTGLDDDLDAACTALMDTLSEKDAVLARDIDRKIYDRGEMPIDHSPQADTIDDIVTSLLRCERLELRRLASSGEEITHKFDPYSLVTYKKGLYLVGYTHDKAQVITLGIDNIREATRCRGETFAYPADHDPRAMFKDTPGIFVGQMTHVGVRFDKVTRRYILRRPIHSSQRVVAENADGSLDVELDIAGTRELESIALSYGDMVEVLSPPALRKKMGEVLRRAAGRYEEGRVAENRQSAGDRAVP